MTSWMKRNGEALWSFVETPDSVIPIAIFRMVFSLFSIIKIAVLFPYLNDVYGQYGYIQWAISKAGLFPFLPHLGDYFPFFNELGFSNVEYVYLFFWIYVISLIFLGCGLFSKFFAFVCFFLHLMWIDTGSGLMYGADVFAQITFFYMLFMPLGRYLSLDVLFKFISPREISISAGISRKLVQFQLVIVYFSSGIEKGLGIQWWNGEAIWRSMMLPSFQQFDLSWLSEFPGLLIFSGWAIVFLETFYPIFMVIPKVRIFGLISIFFLHLSIGVFLGMWIFGAIMIILSCFAFGPEALKDVKRMIQSSASKIEPVPSHILEAN